MGKYRPVIREFTGLNTKGLEDGRRATEFTKLQNARLREGAIKRRLGSVRLDGAATEAKAVDLDGSADYYSCPVDTRVWELGTRFTVRGIIDADSKTGTRPVLDVGHTTPSIVIDTASNKLRVRVWDSAAALTTVTSTDDLPTGATTSFFFTRDGASLSLQIDNGTADTGTMDATNALRAPVGNLYIGYDGTNFFDGTVDSVDLFKRVLPHNRDRLLRSVDPMLDPSCLMSMDMNDTADGFIKDRSRYRNHMRENGSPTEVSALAHTPAPVWAIHSFRSAEGGSLVYVEAGGLPYVEKVD